MTTLSDRELDKLIAIKVMGVDRRRFCKAVPDPMIHRPVKDHPAQDQRMYGYRVCGVHKDTYLEPVPHYSTDLAAAWLVVRALIADGWSFGLDCYETGKWEAIFFGKQWANNGKGETESAAIVAAALKTKDTQSST